MERDFILWCLSEFQVSLGEALTLLHRAKRAEMWLGEWGSSLAVATTSEIEAWERHSGPPADGSGGNAARLFRTFLGRRCGLPWVHQVDSLRLYA